MLELRAAVDAARQTGRPTRRPDIRIDGHNHRLDLQVLPVGDSTLRGYWVLFDAVYRSTGPSTHAPQATAARELSVDRSAAAHKIAAPREELGATRTYFQSVIEQLESGNEELSATYEKVLSSNEELQSTNEELQTAKEELQASNEELATVNNELEQRIRDETLLNNDLTNLFRNIALPVVIVGTDLEVRRFTPAAAELFNLIAGDVGRPITTIKSQLVGDDIEEHLNLAIHTLKNTEVEVCDIRGANYQLTVRPYVTHDNRIDGAVVTLMNIDARKREEAAIGAARDVAEDIIGTVDVPLLVLDDQQRVMSANQAFHDCFATSAASILNRVPDPQLGFSWYSANVARLLQSVLATGESLSGHEVPSAAAVDGVARTFLLGVRRLPRSAGLAAQLLVRIEDISDQRQLQDQLRHAHKMESVGHLAAGIAHDFNNQLTVILGFCDLLTTRLKADAKAREMLGEIVQAGERAGAVTRQLLAFSRKSMVMPEIIDLGRQLHEMVAMLPRLVGEDVQLQINCAPDVGVVFIDRYLFEQALLNLAINARDAMPKGGELRIEVANCVVGGAKKQSHAGLPAGPYVVLRVIDSGVGMDGKIMEHIFEPFYTSKAVGKETGLGLASVHGSVMQSSGFIYVDSVPGRGTTFIIYLPRVTGGLAAHSGNDTAIRPVPRGHEVLLLVEDEPQVRNLARDVLLSASYTVLEAQDGIAALALSRVQAGVIDLLITDIVMPHMGGSELAQILAAERPGLGTLFVSGYRDDALLRSGIDFAAVALLVKPYSPSGLAHRVRALLDLKHAVGAAVGH